MPEIALGEINVDVVYKDIKNIYLSIYPPTGKVRISAPYRLDIDTLRIFAISKLGWIRKQRIKLQQQDRESVRDYVERESHYYLGRRYLLNVWKTDSSPKIELKHSTIEMHARPNMSVNKKQQVLDEWYRQRLKDMIPAVILKWEGKLNVHVSEFGVKKMKTRWGSCNQRAGRIWLNLELAKKPTQCLEYVIVHEMAHLQEKKHGERFAAIMDNALPMWRVHREELNRLPLSHRGWKY